MVRKVYSKKLIYTLLYTLRPDFTSKLVHVLAFGTPKFVIAPYDKIKHELVYLSSKCNVKSGLRVQIHSSNKRDKTQHLALYFSFKMPKRQLKNEIVSIIYNYQIKQKKNKKLNISVF